MTSREKHMARSHRSYRDRQRQMQYFAGISTANGNRRIIMRANRIQSASFADMVKNMMNGVKKGVQKIIGDKENG